MTSSLSVMTIECELPQCTITFPFNERTGRRYCTPYHAKYARHGVACDGGCGALVYVSPNDRKRHGGDGPIVRYCRPCRAARRAAKPRQSLETRRCDRCQDVYTQRSTVQRYCSPECSRRVKNSAAKAPSQTKADRGNRRYRQLRERVKAEEKTCWLCHEMIDGARIFPDPWSFSLDHVRPVALGGSFFDRDNCHAAHLRCNTSRGTSTAHAVRRMRVRTTVESINAAAIDGR
jgi:hypothetical protein